MTSCEDFVSHRLYESLKNDSEFNIIAWHPPNAKSYFTRKIQFTYREAGRRRRYVPDMICVFEYWVMVIECKCNLIESLVSSPSEKHEISDAEKINEIISKLGSQGIANTISLQNPKYKKLKLSNAIPCLAVRTIDTELPNGFIVFEVGEKIIRVHVKGIDIYNLNKILSEALHSGFEIMDFS